MRSVPRLVSSLSIDMNGLIHKAAQKTYAYGDYFDLGKRKTLAKLNPEMLEYELLNNIGAMLLETLAAVNPTDLLVMAVDGVAPVAKMDQQRKRRFRASLNNDSLFNTNKITPGTELMFKIDSYLENWISSNRTQLPPHVIYSSHMVPGEGEHKIFQFMREGRYNVPLNKFELAHTSFDDESYIEQGAHVIHGLDADLIMLSLLAPLDNIYLMREDIADVICIDNLKAVIQAEDIDLHTFVLISFLIGNDFLPHQPALEDIGYAFDLILSLASGIHLVNLGSIDWRVFSSFIERAAKEEKRLLEREISRSVMYPSPILDRATVKKKTISSGGQKHSVELNFDLFVTLWHRHVLGPHGDTEVAAKLGVYMLPISRRRIERMVHQYLDGLDWILRYYQGGLGAIDPRWYYPHHYTPLLTDLAEYIATYTPRPQKLTVGLPYNVIHQLLAVLPSSSQDLIPEEARHLMNLDSPIIDMYPVGFEIDYGGKNAEYQGVALIPHVDMSRIVDAVERNTRWTHERAERYNSTTAVESIRTELEESERKLRETLKTKGERSKARERRPKKEAPSSSPAASSKRRTPPRRYERYSSTTRTEEEEFERKLRKNLRVGERSGEARERRPKREATVASTVISMEAAPSSSLPTVNSEERVPPRTIFMKETRTRES